MPARVRQNGRKHTGGPRSRRSRRARPYRAWNRPMDEYCNWCANRKRNTTCYGQRGLHSYFTFTMYTCITHAPMRINPARPVAPVVPNGGNKSSVRTVAARGFCVTVHPHAPPTHARPVVVSDTPTWPSYARPVALVIPSQSSEVSVPRQPAPDSPGHTSMRPSHVRSVVVIVSGSDVTNPFPCGTCRPVLPLTLVAQSHAAPGAPQPNAAD